jgi:hypothetical protein
MKWHIPVILGCLVCSGVSAQTNGPGTALSFDGSGAFVAIATTGSLTGTFTVELWANPNATNGMQLVDSRFLPNEFGFDLQLWNGSEIHGDIGNGSSWWKVVYDAYFPYNPGDWHHFAVTVTPTNYSIYADGALVGLGGPGLLEGDAVLYDQNHQLGIGWGPYVSDRFYGQIDEVRIWNTARSAAEIQSSMYRSLTGTEPGLMGYWRFDEGSGTTVADASGHGFEGTLTNGPVWVDSTAPIGSQPDGPRLSIQRAGANKAVVNWPASMTGFVLQEATNLRAPAWTNVADPPIEIGGQNVLIITPPTGNRFYRLKK